MMTTTELTDFFTPEEIPQSSLTLEKATNYICRALFQLDGDCDGARTHDAQGFAAFHTYKGKTLAGKLREGGIINAEDLAFIQNALPYYMNTQLSWVDKELFERCLVIIEEDVNQFANSIKDFEEFLSKQDDAWFNNVAKQFDIIDWPFSNRKFVDSLIETLEKRGSLSQKQQYWLRKLTINLLLQMGNQYPQVINQFMEAQDDEEV